MMEGAYSGTKAYLLNLTLKLALDVKQSGLRAQAVLPGATRTEIWERSGMDAKAFPPDMIMDAGDLVDAALAGLDLGETVTIPPLADSALWAAYDAARLASAPPFVPPGCRGALSREIGGVTTTEKVGWAVPAPPNPPSFMKARAIAYPASSSAGSRSDHPPVCCSGPTSGSIALIRVISAIGVPSSSIVITSTYRIPNTTCAAV